MKEGIHPQYSESVVKCGCGNTFTTRSTVPEIKIDICNVCHPFFTGKLKFVDTAGRIEKFKTKFGTSGYASLKKKRLPKPQESRDSSLWQADVSGSCYRKGPRRAECSSRVARMLADVISIGSWRRDAGRTRCQVSTV